MNHVVLVGPRARTARLQTSCKYFGSEIKGICKSASIAELPLPYLRSYDIHNSHDGGVHALSLFSSYHDVGI